MKLENKKSNLEISNEDFAKLIDNSFTDNIKYEKQIIKGNIISVSKDNVLIDVGLKSEGRIPISEFTRPGQTPELKTGDKIDVYVDKLDDNNGEIKLSREKAVKQISWDSLERAFNKGEKVVGIPFSRVKGGLSVDLNGVITFLPGSQVDNKPIKDTRELLNKPLEMIF